MNRMIAVLVAAAIGGTSMAAGAQTAPTTESEKAAKAAQTPKDSSTVDKTAPKRTKEEKRAQAREMEKSYQSQGESTGSTGSPKVDKSSPKRTKEQKQAQARELEKSYQGQGESTGSTGSPKVDKSAPKALPDKAAKQEAAKAATQNRDNKP